MRHLTSSLLRLSPRLLLFLVVLWAPWPKLFAQDQAEGQTATAGKEPAFPVTPTLFLDQFKASEGLTFNARGQLFIGANKGVWRVQPDGAASKITDVYLHLGQAGIGKRDILAADFGPTNVFRDGPNDDGIVWRITPKGKKRADAKGIADPNFILVRKDGSYLVSDDGTDKIYLVTPRGEVSVWTNKIAYPNGLAFSLDESMLYVAQIFKQLDPIVADDRVWALPLKDGQPAGEPKVIGATGEGGLDGLALDEHGRIYIADNGGGKVWRLDPDSGEMVLIAEGMTAVASLVFGEGEFDHHALYATSTFRGGGKIWKIDVGVKGAPLHR